MDWTEEERQKALAIFLKVYPDWNVTNQPRCPKCKVKYPHNRIGSNFCREHHFAYVNWLLNERGTMITAMGLAEPKLQQELKQAGLW
jgi:hypothetical protein